MDKTGLIACTNEVINTEQKCICVTRPRRFGKTMAAKMLSAYYSKGCDSSQLFDDFNVCFKSENQYNHFFNIMPFEIIQKYQKFIVDESSIPIYYYKKLSSYKTEKKNEKNPVKQFMAKKKEEKGKFKNFFKLFSIEYYYNHIISNTENRIISFKSISDSEEAFDYLNNSDEKIDFYSGIESCIFQPGQNLKQANINNSNNNRNSASSFQLLQDAMTIIGIPKCYPNQIIEKYIDKHRGAFLAKIELELKQILNKNDIDTHINQFYQFVLDYSNKYANRSFTFEDLLPYFEKQSENQERNCQLILSVLSILSSSFVDIIEVSVFEIFHFLLSTS